ncbi:MAG: hypothetical protein G01um101418_114 [Parcubacteria group bacterium Gr01-1014_18]|nr:MAG: hypothetical protein Greene041636_418 [Parcubacteria group bacterium Greene0416_36]TSC81441.1 MAG: hypothetical protein G01um101418_114 [Parcubacteria group bacterium Gr01-1014_18]TSC99039.1 MAG: hypothetical protein Greene101420_395 [Parcubacteria group bacterium Greene1014_20]TSD07280.1 MAG: hypothetical protein Greene07142_296 [Parcubacteria group bacterium Greene0714_2]
MQKFLKKLEKQLETFSPDLKRLGVIVVYLFSSQARGDAEARSDVDFAVLLDKKMKKSPDYLKIRLKLMDLLSTMMGREDVEVIILDDQLPLSFKFEILKDGHILYNHDDDARVEFEFNILKFYHDRVAKMEYMCV